jgi:hypothetical protein
LVFACVYGTPQLGQHHQTAVAPAEHALGPAVGGQPAQRRVDRLLIRLCGVEGFAGGPAERGPHHHRLPRPLISSGGMVVVDGGDPAPRRRGRGGAPGQEVDDGVRVGRECGGVGGGAL